MRRMEVVPLRQSMSNFPISFDEINSRARAQALIFLPQLLPSGKQMGREWVALNPRRPDRSLGSFRINIETGRWADFAIGAKGGDFISLAAYVLDIRQIDAAKRVAAIIGAKSP